MRPAVIAPTRFMTLMGWRGEILGLRWLDINLDRQTARGQTLDKTGDLADFPIIN